MEGKSGESGAAEEAPPPSVAKLAGLFGDKVNNPKKEAPPLKPTRRKPPCSLPLAKPEATNNGDEKGSPPHTQMPKIKVKSSPLIEKLQANLAFAPASFLPGSSPKSPSPKSPGLRIMACPFTSPPSTPSSPGFQQRASEEETPASFEQPPDGAPLSSYTKVRTRGSLKRRPPSRRFRKSQGDMDFDIDAVNAAPKENGDKAEEEGTGGLKDKEETETDAPSHDLAEKSHDPAEKSHDPAEKSPESPQEDSGKEEGSPSTAEEAGETPNKEDTPLDVNVTDSPIIKEETVTTEVRDETQNDGHEADKSSEQNKSDGDDKPEK